MKRYIFIVSVLFLFFYSAAMVLFPMFFLKHIQKKYAITLRGQKKFSLLQPKLRVQHASFIWNQKVELREGDFEIEVNPLIWIQSQIWSMKFRGDGVQLRFLGDWLQKTGVGEVKTTRLRLAVQFSNEGISDIDTIDLVSPSYQLQIHSRMKRIP